MNVRNLLLLLPFAVITLMSSCISADTKSPEELKLEREMELAMQMAEQARIDSLNQYVDTANSLIEDKKLILAVQYLDSALLVARYSEENEVRAQKTEAQFQLKKYDDAIEELNVLINSKYNLKDSYYQRALCFQKQRKTQETVNDLKEAIKLGNVEADELHEKINPIRKRVAYYETRCCDGTTSNAKGRGACSHHGGVCNWNDPVYEEYRKY